MVTNTPDVLTDDVADLAIGLMIATARRMCAADQFVRKGEWPGRKSLQLTTKVASHSVSQTPQNIEKWSPPYVLITVSALIST